MKILITGDRNWTDYDLIFWALAELPSGTTIIEGEARGADIISRQCAETLELNIIRMPADWDTYHKAAGPIRNQAMLDLDPDKTFAFHNNIKESKGTRDMCLRCIKKETPVTLHQTGKKPKLITKEDL
jgi:hypothetical protein